MADAFDKAWGIVKNDGDGMEDACENCGRPIENYYDYANEDNTPKRGGGGNNPGIPSLCKRCAE